MASTLENTLNKVGNAIEAIMGGRVKSDPQSTTTSSKGQSNLEAFGMEARKAHLLRNEWKRDIQYTKQLVLAEYAIQTEFTVGTDAEDEKAVSEQKAAQEKQTQNKLSKIEKKKQKLQSKLDELNSKEKNLKKETLTK